MNERVQGRHHKGRIQFLVPGALESKDNRRSTLGKKTVGRRPRGEDDSTGGNLIVDQCEGDGHEKNRGILYEG